MDFGVVFPQIEIGANPADVRDFALRVEEMGFSGVVAYDHVVGADPAYYKGWKGAYALEDMFHEPFVLYGYLAGLTHRIRLITGVIILPQRQTVLVAKQAAAVDVLSGGRLCLGIGIGWNQVEFEALNENFHNRGRRSEEQIEVLRSLWTQESTTFQGRWHRITAAGLSPLPVQRPIPIWFGGGAEPAVKRAARLGDGWFPLFKPDERGKAAVLRFRNYAKEAGRDPSAIALATLVRLRGNTLDEVIHQVREWRGVGADHVYLDTMRAGLRSSKEHIQAIERFKQAVDKL